MGTTDFKVDDSRVNLCHMVREAGDYSLRTLFEITGHDRIEMSLSCYNHGWSKSLCSVSVSARRGDQYRFAYVLADRYASKDDKWFYRQQTDGRYYNINDAVIRYEEIDGVLYPPKLVMVCYRGKWCKFTGKTGELRYDPYRNNWVDVEEERLQARVDPTAEWGRVLREIADEAYYDEDYDNVWVDRT